MTEDEWGKNIIKPKLNKLLKACPGQYEAEYRSKLCYSNEVIEYKDNTAQCKEIDYETDLLVFEWINDDTWKPRVVIELKVENFSSHEAIAYDKKAQCHKNVHPYLRYGVFLANVNGQGLAPRLLRHGDNFDFLLAWNSCKGTSEEWDTLGQMIKHEIKASQTIEEVLYTNRNKDRKIYNLFHRQLVATSV